MPSENLISVLMPVYNGSAYIKEAITSILDQDAEFELVWQMTVQQMIPVKLSVPSTTPKSSSFAITEIWASSVI